MIENEDKLTLTEASKITVGRPSICTLWRWCRKGIGGVKLEYVRAGRRICTSRQAIDRFFRALTENDRDLSDTPVRGSSAA